MDSNTIAAQTRTARDHALAAVDASSLGQCVVGEISHYLDALLELSKDKSVEDNDLRSRLRVINGLVVMSIRFANDMDGLFEGIHSAHKESFDALVGGA